MENGFILRKNKGWYTTLNLPLSMHKKSTPQYLVGVIVLAYAGISGITGFAYAEIPTAGNIGSTVVANDNASGANDTDTPSNQSISPKQKAMELWNRAHERGQGYYGQGRKWYETNNTPIQIIPDLKRVNQLDLLFTVLGILIAAWIALRFFF